MSKRAAKSLKSSSKSSQPSSSQPSSLLSSSPSASVPVAPEAVRGTSARAPRAQTCRARGTWSASATRGLRRTWKWLGRVVLGAGESHGRELDVMTQVGIALSRQYWRAALLGAAVGGAVPWFGRTIAHHNLPQYFHDGSPLRYPAVAVTLGCLLFSMRSVYKFGKGAFGDATKAGWFVAALEGVMVVTDGATSDYALALLVGINAVCNGCVMAVAQQKTAKRAADDARRQATRAATAAAKRAAAQAQVPVAQAPVAHGSVAHGSVAHASVAHAPVAQAPVARDPSAHAPAAAQPVVIYAALAPAPVAPVVVSRPRGLMSAGDDDADFS